MSFLSWFFRRAETPGAPMKEEEKKRTNVQISSALLEEMTPAPGARPVAPMLTLEEVRARYRPARTLGAPEDVQLAADASLAASGMYSLLQHTLEIGQGVLPEFMGYGALQNLSQQGMMRACIGTVADDMTRSWIEVQRQGAGAASEKHGPEQAPKEELSLREKLEVALNGDMDMSVPEEPVTEDTLIPDIMAAMEDCDLQTTIHEAIELMGYEGGAFIYIDTGAQGAARLTPLNISNHSAELVKGGTLRFVAVDPVNVFPGDYNSSDPLSPYFYRPQYWWVSGQRVHASRMLRLVANEVPVLLKPAYNFLGIPQAQILWDYVAHFNDTRVAANRLLTKFSMTVFQTSMFNGLAFGTAEAGQLDTRLRYAIQNMSNDGIFAIDKDAEGVVKLETPLGGVTDIVRQNLELLAAINRTPAVKLLGISPSGFNATGESDIRNYYDHVFSMQEKVLRKPLSKVLDCLQLHLRGEIDKSITFSFAPLGDEDKSAEANIQKTIVDTVCALVDRNIVSVDETRHLLADNPDSPFSSIDPDDTPEPVEMEMPGEGSNG